MSMHHRVNPIMALLLTATIYTAGLGDCSRKEALSQEKNPSTQKTDTISSDVKPTETKPVETIEIKITSTIEGVEVSEDGKKYGQLPLVIMKPKGVTHTFDFSKEGYKPLKLSVQFNEAKTIQVQLVIQKNPTVEDDSVNKKMEEPPIKKKSDAPKKSKEKEIENKSGTGDEQWTD